MNEQGLRGIYSFEENGESINPFEILENSQYISEEDKKIYNNYLTEARDPQDTREILEEIKSKNFEGHKKEAILEVSKRAYLSNSDIEKYISDIRQERNEENLLDILEDAKIKNVESRRKMGFDSVANKKARSLEELNSLTNVNHERWLDNRDKIYNAINAQEIEMLMQEIRDLSKGITHSVSAGVDTSTDNEFENLVEKNEPVTPEVNEFEDLVSKSEPDTSLDEDLEVYRQMGLYEDLTKSNEINEPSEPVESNENKENKSDTTDLDDDLEVYKNMGLYEDGTKKEDPGYDGPVEPGKEVIPYEGNEVVPTEQPSYEKPMNNEIPCRSLDAIIDDLTTGLVFKESDNRKYNAKNIKVTKNFLSKMKQGNYLYNIFGTISSIFTPILQGAQKLYGKILYSKRIKQNVEQLQERLDSLDEADLKKLFEAYRGNVLNSRFHLNSIINNLIGKKLREYVLKNVKVINDDLETKYKQIYDAVAEISQIMEIINNQEIGENEKNQLQERIVNLTSGKADLIRDIRQKQEELDIYWLAGGGLHGIEEDIKAASSKMNLVGKRFAKVPKFDTELMHRQREYKEFEENALAINDDLEAMIGFLSYEKLLSDNTKEKFSLFGKRSVGARDYNPLGKELNYNDDPFFRYVLGSLAVATTSIAAVKGIGQYINAKQTAQNNQNIVDNYTNQVKSSLEGHNDDLIKGQEAQIRQTNLTSADVLERKGLDETNWAINSQEYRVADDANHLRFNTMYQDTEASLNQIKDAYSLGNISSVEALSQMASLNQTTQNNLFTIISEYKPVLEAYKATHPQFDLAAIEGAVNYISNNSNAITVSASAQVELARAIDALQSIDLAQAQVSAAPAIVGALSSALLTTTMVNSTKAYKNKKGGLDVSVSQDDIHNLIMLDQARYENNYAR